MDKIDQKMLMELDKNPRMSASALAKKCRISQQVASYRVNKLVDANTITKFGTIVNLKSLGLEHYRVFFRFHAKKQIKISIKF